MKKENKATAESEIKEKNKSDLVSEAEKYLEMRKVQGKNWMKEAREVYIIDKIWLKAWKEYVNLTVIKKKKNSSENEVKLKSSKDRENNKENSQIVNSAKPHPGEISNQRILYNLNEFCNDGEKRNKENIVVRHDIDQQKSIKIIHEDTWKFFKAKYGGGPEIKSPIVEEKYKRYIELYLSKFNICFLPRKSELTDPIIEKVTFRQTFISKRKYISDLKEKMKKVYYAENVKINEKINSRSSVDFESFRLWKLNARSNMDDLKNLLYSIKKSGKALESDVISYLECWIIVTAGDTDIIIVEYAEKESDYLFEVKKIDFQEGLCPGCDDKMKKMLMNPCSCKEVWYCSEQCKDACYLKHQAKCKNYGLDEDDLKKSEGSKMGLVGLQNLGNTCFMNTSLQCISNCWELTNYFLKNHYKHDINENNPIGSKGILARSYANLLKHMWYGDKSVFSPWSFKRAIAQFQSMFSGYQQHDTQEFLNYVLDGLHEDLNRVLVKPLVEKDDNKKPDNVKSLEHWYGDLMRNQSILVDLFNGQFKSTLYCPNEKCQNISTTFDKFLTISLPLTNKTEPFEVICFFIFYDISISPIQLLLPFSSECTIMAFRNKIAKILDVHPFSFIIVKMDASGNYDHLVSSTSLLKINNYYTSQNQRPFFLFQIDPDLFYSQIENKFFSRDVDLYKKRDFKNTFDYLESSVEESKKLFTEDYEEDESNATEEGSDSYYAKIDIQTAKLETKRGVFKINTDDNHGFDKSYLRVLIYLSYYNTEKSSSTESVNRNRIIFPRIIYINKEWTCEKVHHTLFDYFYPILKKKFNNKSKEALWAELFGKINTDPQNDKLEFQIKNNYPYRIRIKNIMYKFSKPCVVCKGVDCENCLLPYTKDRISDFISKYPKNVVDGEIDNTYLYLADYQRKHHNNWSRDFSLELSWLPDYKPEVHTLNDKVDHDFKLQKSDILTGISIYDCFKKFVKLEKLDEMNEWYCSNCKTHQRATKKMEIYKAPHILIIHLKRFKNTNKLDCLVDYPIVELDMSPYVMSNDENLPMSYDLFAVANHVGGTGFGHYYAFAKNPLNGLFYKFDDSSVTPLAHKDIVKSTAYVLFYRRRDLENIIDLEEIYKKTFINYEASMKNIESHADVNSLIETVNNSPTILNNNI